MDVIESHLDPQSAEFGANASHHRALAAELAERHGRVRQGGEASLRAKHEARGKLFVRDRVDLLLDPGAPFLELSPLAATGLYGDAAPGREVRLRISVMSAGAVT